MAKSKISAFINFVTSGTSGVERDAGKITNAVHKSSNAVEELNRRIKRIDAGVAFQNTITAVGALGTAFSGIKNVVVGAIGGAFDYIEEMAGKADKIGKTSRLLGMTAVELQKIRSAGQDAGMSIESVDSAMQLFSVNTGKAAIGEKAVLDAFNALGVAVRGNDGKIRSQIDLLMDVSDAYAKLTNEQDRNMVSQKLFGRSGVQMSALLGGGSGNLLEQFNAFEQRGGGISNEMAKAGEDFAHSFQFAGEAINGVVLKVTSGLIPEFTKLFDMVTNYVTENKGEIDKITKSLSGKLISVVRGIGGYMPKILDGLLKAGEVVNQIVEFTGPWVPIIGGLAVTVGGSLLAGFVAIKAAVLGIGAVISGPVVAGVAAVAVGIASWAFAIKKIVDNWDMLKSFVVDDVGGAISEMWESAKSSISGFFNSIYEGWVSVKKFILNGAADIAGALSGIPVIGGGMGDVSSYLRGLAAQTSAPENAAVQKQVSESRSVTTNRLQVDFTGVPRGATVKADDDFDYGVVDYSAGYAFGG